MNIVFLIALSLGLSMDAFATALCKGLSARHLSYTDAVICAAYFGSFQAIMPLGGYYVAGLFESFLHRASPIIAFVLLVSIGINMIYHSFKKDDERVSSSFGVKAMLPLAFATSIDALSAGISMRLSGQTNIFLTVSIIGITTFVLSFAGVKIGNIFGARYKSKAEFIGGVILILLGIENLFENFILKLF